MISNSFKSIHTNNFLKYSLLIFATLIILFSFAGNVHAVDGNFGGGDGTLSDPFIIEDEADLAAISSQSSYYYILGGDIHLTSPWEPIEQFNGNLDGKEHTIFGLEIDNTIGFTGLFIQTYGAVITNLTLESANVKSEGGAAGAVVGYAQDTIFNNVAVSGNVISQLQNGPDIGGLVGIMEGGSITSSSFSGNVEGYEVIGGLVGRIESGGSITSSSFSGKVEGYGMVGGLVG
ncbi:MAG: hypothetical protein LBE57_07285 [Methanosarcinales archaeon]|jgi:hypothetical protein|nr:hypothetical protein [Methanosarcinales archaeon]